MVNELRKLENAKTVCEVCMETNGKDNLPCCSPCKRVLGSYFCSKIDFLGKCKICSHSYSEHKRIVYETVQVRRENPEMIEILNNGKSEKEQKEMAVRKMRRDINDIEFELKELEHCQNQFAHFLKRWAISPYNKQALTLLSFVMNKENDKDRSALVSKSLKAHEETVKILEKEMNNLPEGVTSLDSSEIKEKVEQLLCLKHSGKYLKDALAAVTASLNGSIGYADVEVSREIHSITLDEWISKHSTD